MHNAYRRWFRYPLEAAAVWLCLSMFGMMSPATASAIGGGIGRFLGPLLPINRRARRNIALAFPEATPADQTRILRGMWENLGRVVAEYPHLGTIAKLDNGHIEIAAPRNADPVRNEAGGGLFISGHFANWEILGLAARDWGVGYAQVYRAANNPLVERMILRARRLPEADIIPKGPAGARRTVDVMRRRGRIGMLVDQKMNDGISVPFFGHEAMTPPGVAQLALRFDRPIVPTGLERLGGCRFRVTFYTPIRPRNTGDRHQDIRRMMLEVNAFLEQRIRERPEQWLWLHRRWPEGTAPISAREASVPPAAGDRAASGTS